MPIASKGYRAWKGELRGQGWRWWTIALWGIRQSRESKWLKRIVLCAWLPMLYFMLIFFVVGKVTDPEAVNVRDGWQYAVLQSFLGADLASQFVDDPGSLRPAIWALVFHYYMHATQIFLVMIVVAIVGPRLISHDLRTNALSLYFSKPLTRLDYIVGKLAVVAFWVASVTLFPVLFMYLLSIVFSPNIDTLVQTIEVIPRVLAFSLILMIGTGAPILALSSLTRNPRYLAFVWAGAWIMSHVASTILSFNLFPPWVEGNKDKDWTGIVSLWNNFDAIAFHVLGIPDKLGPLAERSANTRWILDDLSYGHDWKLSLLLIASIAVVSLLVVARSIGRPGEAGSK